VHEYEENCLMSARLTNVLTTVAGTLQFHANILTICLANSPPFICKEYTVTCYRIRASQRMYREL
jgi:hypothetical protein